MKKYIKLMRVHHYIKNLLVFATVACSGSIFLADKLISSILGFISFCMVSSVIYIINDINDVEKDRKHPTKKNRPIASGEISIKNAIILAVILGLICIICNIPIFSWKSFLLIVLYFVLNIGYSFGLKDIPILDITILVSGFLIRVLYGSFITDISISNWLYLTVIASAFYFSLGKRRNELKKIGNDKTRKVLKAYNEQFLDKNMYMCLTLTNAFYALWTMDKNTIANYNSEYLIFTVPIVLLITMKYSMNIEGDSDGDPVEVLLHDKLLIVLCTLFVLTMFLILYF